MIIKSIFRLLSATPRTSLILLFLPWGILTLCWGLKTTPYTWEYSGISLLKDQSIPWEIWYCTEDTVGQEAKIFLPKNQNYILYGGSKYFRQLTPKEEESSTVQFPASYCSMERFENYSLPDSVHIIWKQSGFSNETWIPIKAKFEPIWGINRTYTFALLTRHHGQVDFLNDPDSLSKYLHLRNTFLNKTLPENVERKPHSSVW
ncbi:MAG: hypothetical protein IPK50_08785 [Fibrobacterota bacterium]|nr:hypothetical protein [Fibrobacterota bacterium]QQS06977.1 MAG: hypothetical protein IPK50_08785 [Fibrobacterota bacterium]